MDAFDIMKKVLKWLTVSWVTLLGCKIILSFGVDIFGSEGDLDVVFRVAKFLLWSIPTLMGTIFFGAWAVWILFEDL